MTTYVSKKQLNTLFQATTEREFKILEVLNVAKFMTTDQLKRQLFTGLKTDLAAKRATNRVSRKLENEGLIAKLPRRVGGFYREKNGGSSESVWYLTDVGYKVLRLKKPKLPPGRKRPPAPNVLFLEHQLMITEVATYFREMELSQKIEQLNFEFEPNCWRGFLNAGEPVSLKPDLFAKLVNTGYDEAYFIEVDRATESVQKIFKKCQTYVSYFNTGIEEKTTGLTPYIVWVVPNHKRQEQIEKMLREKLPEVSVLFTVIMAEELKMLILGEEKNEWREAILNEGG